jgi:hypothetical protein
VRISHGMRHASKFLIGYAWFDRILLHQPIPAQLAYLHWSSGHDFRLSRVRSRQARETRVRFPDGEHLFLFLSYGLKPWPGCSLHPSKLDLFVCHDSNVP